MENSKIQAVHYNRRTADGLFPADRFGPDCAKKARSFHQSFPEYKEPPLAELHALAKELGVASIHVKDESYRFGLNAFKVLGGSYTIGNYIAKTLGVSITDLPYEKMISPDVKEMVGDVTFVTATDGNHGRGSAWTANRLKQKSVVYMPKGSAEERLKNILALGSDASITDLNYDDAVRLAKEVQDRHGLVLVQDTAWDGYEEIPGWIMEGYTTMADEAVEQLGKQKPSHIFLQAGVGAMSGAICGYFASLYGDSERPVITIVEPDQADCIFRTAKADDGKLHFVTGDMDSIMAGLCCGEPCSIGWNVLKDHADHFISMPDYIAANGMRILGSPRCNSNRSRRSWCRLLDVNHFTGWHYDENDRGHSFCRLSEKERRRRIFRRPDALYEIRIRESRCRPRRFLCRCSFGGSAGRCPLCADKHVGGLCE